MPRRPGDAWTEDTPVGPIRCVRAPDGRTAFPDVIRYVAKGREHDLPPADEPCREKLLDRDKAEWLRRAGRLDLGHAFRDPPKRIDNGPAS